MAAHSLGPSCNLNNVSAQAGGGIGRVGEVDARYLREAVSRFFPRRCVVSALGRSPGFSGSAFARVEASGESWCLRRWPPGTKEERLRFVHRVLLEGRAGGFAGLPDLARTENGETRLALADGLYDAQEWLAGVPLSGRSPFGSEEPVPNVTGSFSPARIAILAAALARFHLSTANISPDPADHASPLPARLTRLAEAAKTRHESLHAEVRTRSEGPERRVALRWLDLLPKAIEAARGACGGLPEVSHRGCAVCHGDLWPAHVLFDGDAFVGFTDFESLSFASPALDLAQLVLHFGGWEIREDVLRGYAQVVPLDERDLSLLPLEAVADLVGEGYWALEALYGSASPPTTAAQRTAHSLNLRELLGSLEMVMEEV